MQVMRTLLRCLGLLSPRRCPDIPVSADKFLQIIHIFETLDVDHREVEELSSLLAQPVVDASHGPETGAHGSEKDAASVDLDYGHNRVR
ncbi:hypothetical protein CDL15_Pgr012524 [Punica granatum]|uniref:Uncharacterized protein n=1 Tax=Punica granatum TaxID=22663 RepID=A0A218XXU8_PUNGR|nr:hypothetical protein CDL15_Pgr012524 [Punica granatum]